MKSKLKKKSELQKDYEKTFSEPCEFWTSEDGSLLALVIRPTIDAPKLLQTHHAFRNQTFDPKKMKRKFAYKEWRGMDFFDGSSGRKRGKVWSVGDEVTPFPVFEYDLVEHDTR